MFCRECIKKDFRNFISLLKNRVPFCYVRYNDGEAMLLDDHSSWVSRNQQKGSEELADSLRNSLKYDREEYWIGVPCPVCMKEKFLTVTSEMPEYSKTRLTLAVLLQNDFWARTVEILPELIKDRPVIIVHGDDQDWSFLKKGKQGVIDTIKLPKNNAWNKAKNFMKYYGLPYGSVVLFSCGPSSRVLAAEWFRHRSDCTCLDIGSCFDPFTRNIRQSYQQEPEKLGKSGNNARYCPLCSTKGTRTPRGKG